MIQSHGAVMARKGDSSSGEGGSGTTGGVTLKVKLSEASIDSFPALSIDLAFTFLQNYPAVAIDDIDELRVRLICGNL